MTLLDNVPGNYRFLPGIAPYSRGVVAASGYEIVHVTLLHSVGWRVGFRGIAEYLAARNRPPAALCGIELRSPRPYSFSGFAAFNAEYTALLESWGVFVDGVNPIARTNVAPVINPLREPVLYGFSFSQPGRAELPPTFVVAGAGELPEGVLAPEGIVAAGDTSPRGLESKARFVMDLMEDRLQGLGVDWSTVSAINVYTAHPLAPLLPGVILNRAGPASRHGVHWQYARPPIEGIEFEMDLRGVRTEVGI
jgi:hypothetical protein